MFGSNYAGKGKDFTMKKRFLCAVLAAVMLLSACDGNAGSTAVAEQEETDVFEALAGLNWDMDYEDVLKALPVPDSRYEDNTVNVAGVGYNSVDFFGCDSKLDIYIQSNYGKRQLYRLAFTINTEDISGTYEKLKEMLTEKYGECKQNTEFVSWEFINDNTTVSLSDWDNELICSFVYVRKPLSGYYDTTTAAKATEATNTTAETEAPEELTVEEIINRCGRVKGWYTYNCGGIRQGYSITLNWGEDTTATVSGDIITADIRNSRNNYQASTCSALYTDTETPNTIVDPFDDGVPLSSFLTEYRNCSDNSRNPYQFQLSDVVLHIKNIDSIEKHGRQGELIEEISDYNKIVPDDTGETYYYLELTADSSEQSYYTEKDISVNAFIRKKDGKAELLIDPAYMYGIPCSEVKSYDINGKEVAMVTREVTAEKISDELLSELTEEYVYAKVTMKGMSIDRISDIAVTEEISSLEIIETDTEKAMNTVYLEEDKESEAGRLYNYLIANKDSLFNEHTKGIAFIDLDFDEHPEILITNGYPRANEDGSYNLINAATDIYRFENNGLKKIDTIYPYMRFRTFLPQLTCKTLEDGSKAWYHMTPRNHDTGEYQDVSYLLQLKGDKLEYTEIFRIDGNENASEYGYYSGPLYYMGERFEPGNPYFEEIYERCMNATEEDRDFYYWKEAIGDKNDELHTEAGNMGNDGGAQLSEIARTVYTAELDGESYSLLSSWLYQDDYYYSCDLINYLTDRMFAYNLAYAVDSAYEGEYNSSIMAKEYNFIGAYGKPVIYLYPEEETEVSVSLDFTYGGELTCTYPEYKGSWQVTAEPDGTLYDRNGEEYYCLYWEAEGGADFDNSKGFCVKGEDTTKFLREKLMYIGLSAREANEFIIYWLPKMQDNEYNVITLHTADYDRSVPLTVSPAPDTSIRVFMTYYPSEKPVKVQEQVLPHFERTGFTLVEWGGSEY